MQSHGDFSCIQALPAGTHYYRFIVDGKWQADPALPVITDKTGEKTNVLEVVKITQSFHPRLQLDIQKKEDSLLSQASMKQSC
jgi:hypothetical protein